MLEESKVDRLVNQYHQINRRYDALTKEENSLGKRVAHLTDEETNEYVKRTSREFRPYLQRA